MYTLLFHKTEDSYSNWENATICNAQTWKEAPQKEKLYDRPSDPELLLSFREL